MVTNDRTALPAAAAASLTDALEHHQAGRLSQAERIYRELLEREPRNAEALHLLGVLAHQCGKHDHAVELINRATTLAPRNASYFCNLAEAYRALGRNREAIASAQMAVQLQPDYPQAENNLALALLADSQLDEAEERLRGLLERIPGFAQAWNNLGQVQRERRQFDEAIASYRRATEIDPQFADPHCNLGQLLLERDEFDAARQHCETALRLKPNMAEAHSNYGNVLKYDGLLDAAHQHYERALQLNPRLASVYGNIARALQQAGNFEEAVLRYQQALEIEPHNVSFHCWLAGALIEQQRYDEADARIQIASRIDPDSPDPHLCRATLLEDREQFEDALDALRIAQRLSPENAHILVRIGGVSQSLGRKDHTRESYRAALQLNPRAAGACSGLAIHFKDEITSDEEQVMRSQVAARGLSDPQRAALHCGLAHLLDRRSEFGEAAEHARRSNELVIAEQRRTGRTYDADAHTEHIADVISAFSRDYFNQHRFELRGHRDETPVFIVGMPRSGTTLTEQILASHPQVHGAGELREVGTSWHSLGGRLRDDLTPVETVNAFGTMDQYWKSVERIADGHIQRLRERNGNAARIVDKLPDNYQQLGWIASMFPRARIIHCRRDVRDVAVSCWMTNFKSIHWSSAFDDLASRIEQYRRIMDHWLSVLPVDVLEVDYEATVTDLDSTARRLIDHVGLDWDPACIAFHETQRPVRTASVSQVREPVYTRSAGRWRNYQEPLSELFTQLVPDP